MLRLVVDPCLNAHKRHVRDPLYSFNSLRVEVSFTLWTRWRSRGLPRVLVFTYGARMIEFRHLTFL